MDDSAGRALADLLTAAASGDRAAFARLYERTSGQLFAVALRILQRRDLAEDVLQESYLAIWQKATQYQPERGGAMPWMATIVRYRAIDRLRSLKPALRQAISFDDEIATTGTLELVEPKIPDAMTEAVRQCLDRLEEKQREALLLAYYYGMTHEELAAHLDAPLGTVKSWVRRGLLQLKEHLDG